MKSARKFKHLDQLDTTIYYDLVGIIDYAFDPFYDIYSMLSGCEDLGRKEILSLITCIVTSNF